MIEIITHKQADKIIRTSEPYGRFIITGNGFFTGIDNTTHERISETLKIV